MNRRAHIDRIGAELLLLAEGARAIGAIEAAAAGPVVVVKGAALAGLVWGPGERKMTDVDLLVQPRALAQAREALANDGWQIVTTRQRPLGSRLHRAFAARAPSGAIVDVHAHLAQSVRWPVRFDDIHARAVPFAFARGQALRPCIEDSVLIAALNDAKDEHAQSVTSSSIEDIARLIAAVTVDWAALVQRARSWRATVALWVALERARVSFGAPVPADVLAQLRPRRAAVLGAALEVPPSMPRRLRQAIVGPLITDSPARFFASASAFMVVRAVDATVHPFLGRFLGGSRT